MALDYVRKLNKIIEATILIGCAKGKKVFIPQILIIIEELSFSFMHCIFHFIKFL